MENFFSSMNYEFKTENSDKDLKRFLVMPVTIIFVYARVFCVRGIVLLLNKFCKYGPCLIIFLLILYQIIK